MAFALLRASMRALVYSSCCSLLVRPVCFQHASFAGGAVEPTMRSDCARSRLTAEGYSRQPGAPLHGWKSPGVHQSAPQGTARVGPRSAADLPRNRRRPLRGRPNPSPTPCCSFPPTERQRATSSSSSAQPSGQSYYGFKMLDQADSDAELTCFVHTVRHRSRYFDGAPAETGSPLASERSRDAGRSRPPPRPTS